MIDMTKIQEMLTAQIFDIFVYKIILSVFILVVFFYLKNFFTNIVFKIFNFFFSKKGITLGEKFLDPFAFLFVILGFYLSISILSISNNIDNIALHIIKSLSYIGFAWILFILIDTLAKEAGTTLVDGKTHIRSELANFIIKFLKTIIIFLTVIGILNEWNYNVSAILASLGLGGLAFALAAKETVANLFGSMVILWDKPFEHGDTIEFLGTEGSVIEIGLRSTTIRTFTNALVTVPNAKLANESITNWSKRKVGRLIKFEIGLRYDSDSKNIKNAITDIKNTLIENDKISKELDGFDKPTLVKQNDLLGYKDLLAVNLSSFGNSSINILIHCFSVTIDYNEWLETKEELMFKIMDILKNNNLDFAFPSQSIYIEKEVN